MASSSALNTSLEKWRSPHVSLSAINLLNAMQQNEGRESEFGELKAEIVELIEQ